MSATRSINSPSHSEAPSIWDDPLEDARDALIESGHLSVVLVGSVEESIELLRELGQLNAASSGIRYWLEDGLVRAANDVRCTELGSLVTVIRQVDEAAATYAPMIAALGGAA